MLKPVKFALIVVGLCAGFLLTAFAAVSGLAMLSPRCYGRDTRLMKAKQQVAGARAAVQTFVMDWGRCPAGVYELVAAGGRGGIRLQRPAAAGRALAELLAVFAARVGAEQLARVEPVDGAGGIE